MYIFCVSIYTYFALVCMFILVMFVYIHVCAYVYVDLYVYVRMCKYHNHKIVFRACISLKLSLSICPYHPSLFFNPSLPLVSTKS